MRTVASISVTPVKGFVLLHPDEVMLTERGVVENRRFFLIDAEGRRLRSSLTDWPCHVHGQYDVEQEILRMRFPDGLEIEGDALRLGDEVECEFKSGHRARARVVDGPWQEPLGQLAGHPVRLARTPEPGDLFAHPVTLLSDASITRLSQEAGAETDGRRFRMLFTVAGCTAHEEDDWIGSSVRIGEVIVRVEGPVDRCAATTRHPDTGERDLDTLRLIKNYRGQAPDGSILFGVMGGVERAGPVRVGDPVEPL